LEVVGHWTAVLFRSNEYNWNVFQSFFTKKSKTKQKVNKKQQNKTKQKNCGAVANIVTRKKRVW